MHRKLIAPFAILGVRVSEREHGGYAPTEMPRVAAVRRCVSFRGRRKLEIDSNSLRDTDLKRFLQKPRRSRQRTRARRIRFHGHHHIVLNNDVSWATVVNEFSTSYKTLAENGFNVHGTITCGGGGTEDTSVEYRTKLEPVLSRYYDYSNKWGVSTQYYHDRISMKRSSAETKSLIDNAIENKEWLVLFAHHLEEVPPKLLRTVLDYLKEKQSSGELEVITYRDLHKRFAVWETPVDLDSMPSLETTVTTVSTTSATATTTTTSSRLQHTRPTYLTTATTTAVSEVAPEPQAPESSAPEDFPADTEADKPTGEKDPPPWTTWAIVGAAVIVCTAGAIAVALIWRKEHTPPTE